MPRETVLLALNSDDFPDLRDGRQVLVPGAKHPANPILRPRAGQWDGTRCKVYGAVLYDPTDKLFKMWYSGGTDTPDAVRRFDGARRHVGYAHSEDGVHWERPNLGLIEYNGSRNNNLIVLNAQAPNVFVQPDAAPDQRYVMVTETGLNTYHNKILYSADGIRWTPTAREPIASDTKRGRHDPFSILHDPEEPDPARRWKGYSLLHANQNGYRGRAVGLFFGSDLTQWTEHNVQPIMSPFEGMESEIHIAHVSRFHDTYVMLYDAMEPNHHTQAEIAVSHNGVDFRRIQNGVKLLANGRPGEPDAGKICVSPRSLLVHEGKIWWYYTMSTDTYQTGPRGLTANPWYRYTGLAQWREDGFAYLGVAAADQTAQVTSHALTVEDGDVSIWLNAVALPSNGGILVEIVDSQGAVMSTSQRWVGDQLHGAVDWQDGPPTVQPGQTVTLRLSFFGITTQVYAIGLHGLTRSTKHSQPLTTHRTPDSRHRWTFQAQAKISACPTLYGDTLYVGSWDQHLYAIDAQSGALRWQYATGNAITTTPVVHQGVVYCGARDGHVYAFDAATGAVQWQQPIYDGRREIARNPNGAWIDSSPTVGAWTCRWGDEPDAPQRLFVGCHDRNLHAYDLASGVELWRHPTYNWILSQPAVADYTVYFGSLDGHIYAVDGRSGALRWRYRVGRYLTYAPTVVPGSVACEGVAGSPLVVDGTLYCGADDGFLYALDAATGAERWTFQTEKWIWGRPLLVGGVLIVASADGRVYGLDAASGKPLWRRGLPNAIYADVVARGDEALIACTDGVLYALRPATGDITWTYAADAGLRAAPAVGPDGAVYLPSCSGAVVAIRS